MMAAGLAAGGCCTKANHPAHIVDSIGNADKYVGLNPHFKEAFAFLQRPDLAKLAVGRYDLVPGKCWAMIQEPDLHSVFGAKTECHRKYIDIQAPIAREETMGPSASRSWCSAASSRSSSLRLGRTLPVARLTSRARRRNSSSRFSLNENNRRAGVNLRGGVDTTRSEVARRLSREDTGP